jgi:hypothetical protein
LILPKDVLDLLEIDDEVDVQVVGNTMMIAPPDIDPDEVEATLAYLISRRERAAVYERLA